LGSQTYSTLGLKVIIGPNAKKIPAYCFRPYNSNSLGDSYIYCFVTEVDGTDAISCLSINNYAFYNCTRITKVVLPPNL
jgi:hypothetical protein